MKHTYKPRGVCAQFMDIEVEQGVVTDLKVRGGCSGNLQGISSLVKGMRIDDVIARLKGIRCGMKNTSCPDQIASALEHIRQEGRSE